MKKFILLLSGLVLIGIQACFAAPVMMGIELELQGITYENASGAVLMDHIRLFESEKKDLKVDSKTKGAPNWYLEVDGSGNIEFVSRPMDLTTEKDLLVGSLKEMCILMKFLLLKAVLIKDPNGPYFLFTLGLKEENNFNKLDEIGTFIHLKPLQKGGYENIKTNIQIKISEPLCFVKPQATFQIPLSKAQNFVHYMAICHKHLSATIKEINKVFNNSLKVNTCGEGLAYLVMVTSELLKNNYSKRELGPKGILTLMSRASFSKMYEQLDEENKLAYHNVIKIYAVSNNYGNNLPMFQLPLFQQPYTLFCGGEDITRNASGELTEIGKYINKITIGNFLESITQPTNLTNKVFFEQANDLLKNTLEQKKQLLLKEVQNKIIEESIQSIDEVLQNIQEGLFVFEGTDLLSPPPLLPHTYSLGKYKDIPSDTAVIEMRGYTGQYGNKIKMGPLVFLWLQRETENAINVWDKEIFPWFSYQEKSKLEEEKYQKLDKRNKYIVDILEWFNQGKTIEIKLSQVINTDYVKFFTYLNETQNDFLAALKKDKIASLIKEVEEKRLFVLSLF